MKTENKIQTIYAMSDIHGMIGPLRQRLEQLDMDELRSGRAKLVFLGDYIDWGINSLKVLETIYGLCEDLGENVVVLMGNHDKWFLEFLHGHNPNWLGNFQSISLLESFMSEDDLWKVRRLISRYKQYLAHDIVLKSFTEYNPHLRPWMESFPLYYETGHQIYVHAGIDEEAEDLWAVGTSDEMFYEKYPPTKGHFYKDIIAGHVSVSTASRSRNNHDIYYDGESHFFIDGIDSYPANTKEKDRVIPLLKYTEENGTGYYYSISPTGQNSLICEKKW